MNFKILFLGFFTSSFSFAICNQLELSGDLSAEGFKHSRNSALSWFDPHHSASDVITVDHHDADINVKFSYGPMRKDLADENIEVWIDTCGPKLVYLGKFTTDSDGRIKQTFFWGMLPDLGSYKVWARVMGDNTFTSFTLQILKRGTLMTIFDIDGTLTHSDINPSPRMGAVELTHALKGIGREIVYLSGRPYLLTRWSRTFLSDSQFAEGSLIVAQSMSDILPGESYVGEYKANYLKYLKNLGLVLERAYGDKTTDVYAYQSAQIPNNNIFIMGSNGGYLGTVALGEDYLDHYVQVSNSGQNNRLASNLAIDESPGF